MIEDIRENILTYIQIYQQSPFKLITLIVDIKLKYIKLHIVCSNELGSYTFNYNFPT